MKRARTILGSLVALALLAASVVPAWAQQHDIKEIQKRGELWVGTTASMPPLNMQTKDGAVIGWEADMARAFADALGVKLKFKVMDFDKLLPALESRHVDMIISGMTITPRRNTEVAFVGPYFVSGKAFLTKDKTIAEARDASQLKDRVFTVATLKGSTSQAFIQETLPKAKLVTTDNYDQAVKMVLDNKVDALFADYPITIVSLYRFPDKGLVSIITPVTYEPLGVALHPEDPLLINWTQNFINILQKTGQLDAWRYSWFGKRGDWVKQLR